MNRRKSPRNNLPSLFGSSRTWGRLRLLLLVGFLFLFMYLGWAMAQVSPVHGFGLRYALFPPLIVVGALLFGVRIVQSVYGLKTFRLAAQFLGAALFGVGYPSLRIQDGKKKIEDGEENLLACIGGPGFLLIDPGNVVLLEVPPNSIRVLAPGIHTLSTGARIKEILYLQEKAVEIPETSAITQDGIEVKVKNIRFRFRMLRNPESGRLSLADDPYSFSEEAVYNMVYNRTLTRGEPHDWAMGVKFSVEGSITYYINHHPVDHLTAPKDTGSDPRDEIYERLHSNFVRDQMKERGAELLWFDIGHFEIPEKVAEQRLSNWQTHWVGDAKVLRAYGDSQRTAYQELGRAEAQAEILMSIVHALNDIEMQGDSREHLRSVILMRTAQILEAMGDQKRLPEKDQHA